MAFAIKAAISDPTARSLSFTAQKTMYGGKRIARGDTIFVFASEQDGGQGLLARSVVISVRAVSKTPGLAVRHLASASKSGGPHSQNVP